MAALILPSAVLTHLKAGERAALGPDPVLTTWCAHPASATPAKHCRPNVSPFLPHALHKVVSPIVRDERYLVNKIVQIGTRSVGHVRCDERPNGGSVVPRYVADLKPGVSDAPLRGFGAGPVAKVGEIEGGVISGLCNEPDSA